MKRTAGLAALAAICLAVPAARSAEEAKAKEKPKDRPQALVAVLHPTAGNAAKGVVRFSMKGGKVVVQAEVEGLTPGQQHAIHIHEFGDCTSADGTSAGGHYNPEGHDHALPSTAERHAGDLGNMTADASGKAVYSVEVENVTLVGRKNPIVGRSVIVHAKPDDGSQPTGNAGPRIACGVIGIAGPAPEKK